MKMHAYLSELHECKTQIKGSEQCMETTTTNTNKIKQLRAFKKMPYARIEVKKKQCNNIQLAADMVKYWNVN